MKIKIGEYLTLILIVIFGVIAFLNAAGDRTMQLVVAGISCALYVLWGIFHHILSKTMHIKIVIEYLLIGLIAFVLVATAVST